MEKLLILKILLTVSTVFATLIGLYSTIPQIRKKYEGQTVRFYIAIGSVITMMILNIFIWYKIVII